MCLSQLGCVQHKGAFCCVDTRQRFLKEENTYINTDILVLKNSLDGPGSQLGTAEESVDLSVDEMQSNSQ